MILREVADILIRSVSAAVNTNDGRYDPIYVEKLIPQLREQAAKIDYFGDRSRAATRRIDYSLTQQFTVTRDANQDNDLDYITFTVPKPMSIGRVVDGLVYVGSKDKSYNFSKLMNREDAANMAKRGVFNGKMIGYWWENPNKLLFIGNKMLQEVNVRGVLSDPTQAPAFLIESHDYPISETILAIMIELFKANQNVNINRPTDIVEDGKETIR